jgi:hypothetical protein
MQHSLFSIESAARSVRTVIELIKYLTNYRIHARMCCEARIPNHPRPIRRLLPFFPYITP